jgi:hypothetical protein
MAKSRRIKSKTPKKSLTPIPHNNRGHLEGRMASTQIITMLDPDPDKKGKLNLGKPYTIQKTIFHMNLSPFEQRRIHLIKTAIEAEDIDILKKLNARERKLYDGLLAEKKKREGIENDGDGNNVG